MEGSWTLGQRIEVFLAHHQALTFEHYERGSDEYWQLLAKSTTGKSFEQVQAYLKESKQYNYDPIVPVGDSGTNASEGLVGDSGTDAGDNALEQWEEDWRILVGDSSTDAGANASEEWKEGLTKAQRLYVLILHHQALKSRPPSEEDEWGKKAGK